MKAGGSALPGTEVVGAASRAAQLTHFLDTVPPDGGGGGGGTTEHVQLHTHPCVTYGRPSSLRNTYSTCHVHEHPVGRERLGWVARSLEFLWMMLTLVKRLCLFDVSTVSFLSHIRTRVAPHTDL